MSIHSPSPPALPHSTPTLPSKRPSLSLLQTPPPLPPLPHSPSLSLPPIHLSPHSNSSPLPTDHSSNHSSSEFQELPPVKLYNTREQRELSEQLADLYSLLVTIEHVETAYVRDAISNTKESHHHPTTHDCQHSVCTTRSSYHALHVLICSCSPAALSSSLHSYTTACNRLLAQYKTLREALGKDFPDLTLFCSSLSLNCKAAINRLRLGVPATTLHGGHEPPTASSSSSSLVFRAAQSYITVLDALKLGMRAVDQLVPLLSDIMNHVNQMADMPSEHEARVGVRDWLVLMNGMRAHEELTSEQARQCEFDLQKAYDAVYRFLEERDKRHQQQHHHH